MSYYSDFKAGLITDDEYTRYCNREAAEEAERERQALREYEEEAYFEDEDYLD